MIDPRDSQALEKLYILTAGAQVLSAVKGSHLVGPHDGLGVDEGPAAENHEATVIGGHHLRGESTL